MPHLDLLPLARRLWRDRLPSRALGYLETSVLGAARTQEEVPGWMIPELYFEYLRSGDARPMAGVFYHNSMDVLSLGALFNLTARFLDDPLSEAVEENVDRIAIARLYDELGRADEAVGIYRSALERGLPEAAFWETIERLSMLLRRMGDWPAAVELWLKAGDAGQIYACIELAKYYEHHAEDLQAARVWTERAMKTLDVPRMNIYQKRQAAAELQHRMERLKRKIERGITNAEEDEAEE
jgi:tetratricopeptide (TPR) repeat protein